jgi:hypothetical protein
MIGKLEIERRGWILENFFVNRTTLLWDQLPADAVGNLSCKPSNSSRSVREVIKEVK